MHDMVPLRGGCPIRTFTDQRLFAPPRNFSQLITSFFASESLGIHRTPLLTFFLIFLQVNLFFTFPTCQRTLKQVVSIEQLVLSTFTPHIFLTQIIKELNLICSGNQPYLTCLFSTFLNFSPFLYSVATLCSQLSFSFYSLLITHFSQLVFVENKGVEPLTS